MLLTYNTIHFDVKGRKQEMEHCKFLIAALTLPHIRAFHSFLLTEESSILFQRLFLAHLRQILTVKAYKIYFYSACHKLELLCYRETRWATFSFRICKISMCQPLSTMSSAFYCDLRRKDSLVILFMQVCSTLLFEDSLTALHCR